MRDRNRVRLLLAGCALAVGCASPAAIPTTAPLLSELRFAPLVPDEADHAAADLAAAALGSNRIAAAVALQRLQEADSLLEDQGHDPSGLAPAAIDVLNATLFEGRAYRDATGLLLAHDDLAPALRARLEQGQRDDPLVLAKARIRDARTVSAARLFNALAEPAGHALFTSTLVPYHLAQSVAQYLVDVAGQDPLPIQRRQALVHWKEFLARYPNAAESADIARRVEKAEDRWKRTQLQYAGREAKRALAQGAPRRALFHAARAVHYAPGDEDARALLEEAEDRVRVRDEQLRWSVQVAEHGPERVLPPGTRELALALLAPDAPLAAVASGVGPDEPLAAEAAFALTLAHGDAGDDPAMWKALGEIADASHPMARHANAALRDPVRNPYQAFVRARARDRRGRLLWIAFGPAMAGPEPGTTGAARWLLGLPGRLQAIGALPLRLIQAPFGPPPITAARTALQARRYLALLPGGRRSEEVRGWLEDYERDRENWIGALQVATARTPTRGDEIETLREKAAVQALRVASREERRDLRNAMLHNVTREFGDTRAGREAGRLARKEALEMTAHQVRISRGFLEENPGVAGPEGLGLDPVLLDGDASNGELHPAGVTLVGGHDVELAFISAKGDEDDPPERVTTRVSDERLGRLVARLEEESFRNSLLDRDDDVEPDSQRDLFFERARLGLAEDVDTRATAEARYAYRGMRERYGMVRARESILPFDVVVQGDLGTLSLGAFPRLRTPRRTPDSILYE